MGDVVGVVDSAGAALNELNSESSFINSVHELSRPKRKDSLFFKGVPCVGLLGR